MSNIEDARLRWAHSHHQPLGAAEEARVTPPPAKAGGFSGLKPLMQFEPDGQALPGAHSVPHSNLDRSNDHKPHNKTLLF